MKLKDYFQIIFGPDFPGFISIWEKQTKNSKFYDNTELDAMRQYLKKTSKTKDVYFGCGLLSDKQLKGRGKYQDILGLPGFWMDLDIQSDVHKSNFYPTTIKESYKILKEFPLAPTIIISSGYGLHVLWLFDKLWIFLNEDERKQASVLSGKFQDSIIAIFKKHGYTLDKTADLTRVLRIHGTLNHKKEPAVLVRRLKTKDDQMRRYTLEEIENAIEEFKPKLKSRLLPKPREITKNNYPDSQVEKILAGCQWFRHCQTDASTLSEPEWFFLLTIVAFCENPLQWAYKLSSEYDGFSQEETMGRVMRIRRTWTKPVSCNYIAENFDYEYCKSCPHKVKSPFQLGIDKSDDTLKLIGFGFDDEGRIRSLNGNVFSRYILHRYKLIYTESGFFFEYFNGVWHRLEHNQLFRKNRNLVHEFVPDFWTKRIEDNYFEALKREAPVKSLNTNRNYLNLNNGMLELNTFKFVPHSSEFYSSIQLPISFDEEAKCPEFNKFLDDIFEGDKQRIRIIKELLGYCLTADTSAQKAFFFYGQGSNGKSLLTEVFLSLCGVQNTSAIPLEELGNSFNRYELVDKLLNMTTENEVSPAGLNTAPFKAIVSGDPIQVEKKYEQSFMYRPFCKLIYSLNTLPYSRDKSWGFQRRLIVIPFNRTFRETEADFKNYNELRSNLLKELPGILNQALKGLKRLRKNNYVFSYSRSIKELQTEYKQVLNPYSQFVAEMIKQGNETDKISNETMHRVFENWCLANGHKKLASSSNLKRLIEIRNALKDAKIDFRHGKGYKSGNKRYIGNIKLKTINDTEFVDMEELED